MKAVKIIKLKDAPPCSPPPYELACRMLNAIGWNGNDFRLRDPVALAIAPEVERINRRANSQSVKEAKQHEGG